MIRSMTIFASQPDDLVTGSWVCDRPTGRKLVALVHVIDQMRQQIQTME